MMLTFHHQITNWSLETHPVHSLITINYLLVHFSSNLFKGKSASFCYPFIGGFNQFAFWKTINWSNCINSPRELNKKKHVETTSVSHTQMPFYPFRKSPTFSLNISTMGFSNLKMPEFTFTTAAAQWFLKSLGAWRVQTSRVLVEHGNFCVYINIYIYILTYNMPFVVCGGIYLHDPLVRFETQLSYETASKLMLILFQ